MKQLCILLCVFALAACDTGGESDDLRDGLSAELSVLATTQGFGGVSFERPSPDGTGDALLVVHTLGKAPAAEAEVARLLAGYDYRLDRRPAQGAGTAELVARIDVLEPIVPIEHHGRTAHRVEVDAETGYVEVGVWTVFAAQAYQGAMERAGIPTDDVALMVEDRPASR